jgi:hypothetical protein
VVARAFLIKSVAVIALLMPVAAMGFWSPSGADTSAAVPAGAQTLGPTGHGPGDEPAPPPPPALAPAAPAPHVVSDTMVGTNSLITGLIGLVNGLIGVPGTTAPSLSAVFKSLNLGNLLQAIGCPIAQALPSPPAPSQIASVLCALGILNYAFRTVYVEPNGTKLTRITRALIGLPTPIDVNGDGLPDFLGTLVPGLNGTSLTLDISRLALSATARTSIEAVALDPAAPLTYVGAGEDGLGAGTDTDWSATVNLLSSSTSGNEITLTQKNTGPPATVGTIGEIFSGSNPDSPTNTARGDVNFTPVPATITADVTLGQSSQAVAVTSSSPTRLGGTLSLISPSDDKEITAVANQIGKSVSVDYTQPTSGETKLTYVANAVVTDFSAQYHDTAGGVLATAAALDASLVPTGLAVDQVGSQTTVTTTGGALGSVEARYGSGREAPAAVSGTGAYASYHGYADGTSTIGVRLPNLLSLTLNAAEPLSGDLSLSQPLDYVSLSAQDDTQGYAITGRLQSLPQHTSVGIGFATTVDPITNAKDTTGTVSFKGDNSGTPAGIAEIAADITNTQGAFFGRADEIDATIDSIPSSDTITVDYGDSGLATPATTHASASATNPIGSISALAGDGSAAADNAPATDTGSGVWYVDTNSAYYAFARINQLTGYNVSLGEDDTGSITALSGAIGTAGQDVTSCSDTTTPGQDISLDAQTDGGTFTGAIDQLPTSVSFSMAPDSSGNTIVDYKSSAPIRKITADADGFSSIAALGVGGDIAPTMDSFHAEVDCLPAHMTMDMDKSGETSLNTYGDHIGEVIAQVYNHQLGPATPVDVGYADATNSIVPAPSGDQLAYYDPATKGISIDLKNVGGFDFLDDDTTSVLTLKYDLDSSTPLAFDYISQSLTSPLGLSGTVEKPQPGTLTVDTATDGTMTMQFAADGQSSNLTGDGGLGTINFDGFVKDNYLQGAVGNVPANLSICLDYSTGVEDCGPPWVYTDEQDYNNSPNKLFDIDNPPQLFAIHVLPTDLNGNVVSTPLTLSGEFCFGSALKSDCDKTGANQGGGPAGLFIPAGQALAFDTLWLGFGQKTDNCHLSFTCGRAWFGLDTTDEGADPGGTLAGKALYYQKNDNDVTITFDTNSGGFLKTNQLYVYADYNVGAALGLDEISEGSISCGAGGKQGLLLNEGPGIDLLTNSVLGLCP